MIVSALLLAFADPPATVLEHRLEVQLDWGRRLRSTQTWIVRIDDPAACIAGLIAPPGLDGATDGGAMVLQDLLIVPENTEPGQVFTLRVERRAPRGQHSGIFETAPDLPVEKASFSVQALGSQPLTVWADPLADPVWSTRRGKRAEVSWPPLEPGERARATWSSWTDWFEAGSALEQVVDAKVATKGALGRELAADVGSSNLPEIARHTLRHITLDPTATAGWEEARNAATIAHARAGSAAERGLVLISMLRAAGYEAGPAMLRSTSGAGTYPVAVPSPAMFDAPLVWAKDRAGDLVWIDPGSDAVAVPERPSALIGATVWVPGDLPSRPFRPGVADGTVTLTTSAKVGPDGAVQWSTQIHADGAGLQAIRTLLRPLDARGQEQALRRLVEQGRPALQRFSSQISGTSDPYKPLQITVSGSDDGVFLPRGGGLWGRFVPVLGPAMAAWLPPNIRVIEVIDVAPPPGFRVAAHARPGPAYDPSAQINRTVRRYGDRLRIDVDTIRPYTASTSAREAAAHAFLAAQATEGVEVVLFPPIDGKVIKRVALLDASEAEIRALQAALWWGANDDRRARKIVKKALQRVEPDDLVDAMIHWVGPGDPRPWDTLESLLEPRDRLALAERLVEPFPDAALAIARPSMQHPDAQTAARALLVGMQVAPSQEVRNSLASRLGELEDPSLARRARLWVAEFDLDHGQNPAMVAKQVEPDTPRGRLIHLAARAPTLPLDELVAQVDALRAEAPTDPRVASRGADLLSAGRLYSEALDAALDAARLAHDDHQLWAKAADAAVRAGDLHLALDAAQRASDLAPTDTERAAMLHHLALLALDAPRIASARERDPSLDPIDTLPGLDELMGLAAQHELLAVLQHHDAAVEQSPVQLALRAQLRADAGLRDEAARDGIQLARLHGEPQGRALAFAALAGRVFGSGALSLLDDVRDPTARLVRLDYRLITASGDARADALAIRDEPRAADVLLALGDPSAAAAKIDGWPTTIEDLRLRPPPGYRSNPVLTAARGVEAFSHPDRQLAILVINATTDRLPPPLASLFTTSKRPLAITEEGAELYALTDGYLPLYAARLLRDGRTLYGLGFTPEAARRALRDAPR